MVSKAESPRKVSGWKCRCRAKKSESTGFREKESPTDLSLSGESDLLCTGISGCACMKVSSKKVMCQIMPSPFVRMANLSV